MDTLIDELVDKAGTSIKEAVDVALVLIAEVILKDAW